MTKKKFVQKSISITYGKARIKAYNMGTIAKK